MQTLIMKFGGSSVSKPGNFSKITKIIIERKKIFKKIVVVVSAMGNATDNLIKLAKKVNDNPPSRELDMLISVGERISISLLAMALSKKNQKAVSFTGSQSGIITCDNHFNAKIVDVKPERIVSSLNDENIVIVAGFQGVSKKKDITTLGRGGSDTSAVALGVALKADRVEFYKDVDGIYSEDPKINKNSKFHPHLSYHKALEICKKADVLHPRCIDLAKKNSLPLVVTSYINQKNKTVIQDKNKKRTINPIFEGDYSGS